MNQMNCSITRLPSVEDSLNSGLRTTTSLSWREGSCSVATVLIRRLAGWTLPLCCGHCGVPPRLPGGQQVYVDFKHPPRGILHLGLVALEQVPITNPTIAAQLRRAIIFVGLEKKKVSREPKSSWRPGSHGGRVCL